MEALAHWLGILLLGLACLAALATLVLGIPGTFLLVGIALVYAWATGFAEVTWALIGGLLALAVIAEIIEFFSTISATTEARKPSRRVNVAAIAGALCGGILGAPILFGLGALLGAFAGAFAGAALAAASEGQDRDTAIGHGLSALRGRVLGFVVKSAIAIVMIVWLVTTAA